MGLKAKTRDLGGNMIDAKRFRQNFTRYAAQLECEQEERQRQHRELAALCCLTGYRQNGYSVSAPGTLTVYDDDGNPLTGPVDEVLFALVEE
jgi:hypothetical protein